MELLETHILLLGVDNIPDSDSEIAVAVDYDDVDAMKQQ